MQSTTEWAATDADGAFSKTFTGLVEVTTPEELAVVGSVTMAAEQGVEPLDRMLGTHGNRHHQAPEVRSPRLRKMPTLRSKETGRTVWYTADGNHAVFLPSQCVIHHSDRPETPLFCCTIRHHNQNRSV